MVKYFKTEYIDLESQLFLIAFIITCHDLFYNKKHRLKIKILSIPIFYR